MSSEEFVDAIEQGNNIEAEQAFKKSISDKVGFSLEGKRREVANSFVQSKKVEKNEEEV